MSFQISLKKFYKLKESIAKHPMILFLYNLLLLLNNFKFIKTTESNKYENSTTIDFQNQELETNVKGLQSSYSDKADILIADPIRKNYEISSQENIDNLNKYCKIQRFFESFQNDEIYKWYINAIKSGISEKNEKLHNFIKDYKCIENEYFILKDLINYGVLDDVSESKSIDDLFKKYIKILHKLEHMRIEYSDYRLKTIEKDSNTLNMRDNDEESQVAYLEKISNKILCNKNIRFIEYLVNNASVQFEKDLDFISKQFLLTECKYWDIYDLINPNNHREYSFEEKQEIKNCIYEYEKLNKCLSHKRHKYKDDFSKYLNSTKLDQTQNGEIIIYQYLNLKKLFKNVEVDFYFFNLYELYDEYYDIYDEYKNFRGYCMDYLRNLNFDENSLNQISLKIKNISNILNVKIFEFKNRSNESYNYQYDQLYENSIRFWQNRELSTIIEKSESYLSKNSLEYENEENESREEDSLETLVNENIKSTHSNTHNFYENEDDDLIKVQLKNSISSDFQNDMFNINITNQEILQVSEINKPKYDQNVSICDLDLREKGYKDMNEDNQEKINFTEEKDSYLEFNSVRHALELINPIIYSYLDAKIHDTPKYNFNFIKNGVDEIIAKNSEAVDSILEKVQEIINHSNNLSENMQSKIEILQINDDFDKKIQKTKKLEKLYKSQYLFENNNVFQKYTNKKPDKCENNSSCNTKNLESFKLKMKNLTSFNKDHKLKYKDKYGSNGKKNKNSKKQYLCVE